MSFRLTFMGGLHSLLVSPFSVLVYSLLSVFQAFQGRTPRLSSLTTYSSLPLLFAWSATPRSLVIPKTLRANLYHRLREFFL